MNIQTHNGTEYHLDGLTSIDEPFAREYAFTCYRCHKNILYRSAHTSGATGYGIYRNDHFNEHSVCYPCCAEIDKENMRANGRILLYFVKNDKGQYEITNWCGTLRFPVTYHRSLMQRGFNGSKWTANTARFMFEGKPWIARQSGDNQIARCKALKA